MSASQSYRVEAWSAQSQQTRNGRVFRKGEITHFTVTNYDDSASQIKSDEIESTAAIILPINPNTNVDEQRKIAESIKDYLNKIQDAKERAVNAAQLGFLK